MGEDMGTAGDRQFGGSAGIQPRSQGRTHGTQRHRKTEAEGPQAHDGRPDRGRRQFVFARVRRQGRHRQPRLDFRYQLPGQKVRDMGLGSLDRIGLAKARELARQHREFIGTGIDPIERRNEQRVQVAAKVAVPTFDDLAAIHRDASIRLAQSGACEAMGNHLGDLCQPSVRQAAGERDQHRPRAESVGADLARKNRHREAGEGAH